MHEDRLWPRAAVLPSYHEFTSIRFYLPITQPD